MSIKSWFDALDKMYKDIRELDFDVAIVGCGAYGLPLAAKIKSLGKAGHSFGRGNSDSFWYQRC